MLLILFTSFSVAGTKPPCDFPEPGATPDFARLVDRLEAEMASPEKPLKALEKSADYVEVVGEDLDKRMGAVRAVYRVRTPHGNKVIKIYSAFDSLDTSGKGLLLQKVLGELDFAPAIDAILPEAEVRKLIESSPRLKENPKIRHGAGFAVVMDEVEEGWVWSGQTNAPPQIKDWNLSEMIHRASALVDAMNQLRIVPQDTQFIISRSGKIYVFDLDRYAWLSRDHRFHGYAAHVLQEEHAAMLESVPKPMPVYHPPGQMLLPLVQMFQDAGLIDKKK